MTLFIIQASLWVVCLSALALCAAIDVRERIIPNECVAVIAAAGLALAAISWPGQLWISVVIAIVILVVLGFLSRLRLLGGGDVKLISAVSLLTPPTLVGKLLVTIILAGGVLSCVYLAAGWRLRRTVPVLHPPPTASNSLFANERVRIAAGGPLPYGVAIVCGAVFHLSMRFF